MKESWGLLLPDNHKLQEQMHNKFYFWTSCKDIMTSLYKTFLNFSSLQLRQSGWQYRIEFFSSPISCSIIWSNTTFLCFQILHGEPSNAHEPVSKYTQLFWSSIKFFHVCSFSLKPWSAFDLNSDFISF